MWRYLRLYAHFVRFSFSRAMEFRFDFFFRVGMDAIWYAVIFGFFKLLFLHTSSVGGWNESQALLLAGGLFLSDAIYMTVFANNTWYLPVLVNKGDLDYYLVRPVSSLFFITTRQFAVNSLLNVFLAAALVAGILATHPHAWELSRLPLYIALLLLGVFLEFTVKLLFLIPVFWLHNASGLRELAQGLDGFSQRPDGIFTGPARRILTTLLPLLLIVSFPTRVLFDPRPWDIVLHMLAVTAGLYTLVLWTWRAGLRSYSSASS